MRNLRSPAPARRIVLLAIAAFVAPVASTACGGAADRTSAQAAPRAVSPGTLFLTAAELDAVPGAPAAGFTRQRLDPSSFSPNPDPRGPCGAKLEQPSFGADGLALFTSSANMEVFQWTRRLPPGEASQLVAAMAADVRPGCAAFTSRTPFPYAQLNQFLGAIRLPDIGDQRVAVAERVRQNHGDSPWTYASEAFIRRGDYLTAIMVISVTRQRGTFVRGLAVRAAARLEQLPAVG